MKFFIGLHMPNHAADNSPCMISVNRLRNRKSAFAVGEWIMDSGAFTEISKYGRYRDSEEVYAAQINRWADNGKLLAAVSQDYMCEPFILAKTGLTIQAHQALTIARYKNLQRLVTKCYVMPVLQGWTPEDYVAHLRAYGSMLKYGAWVGVGSVCKRNTNPRAIEDILIALYLERPDLQFHLFGVKLTALESDIIQQLGYSTDSMSWSFEARRAGTGANDPANAKKYVGRVAGLKIQGALYIPGVTA